MIAGTAQATGNFNVTIVVTDARQTQDSRLFALTVTSVPQLQTSSPLPQWAVGVAYSTTFSTTGGAAPYTYALLSGTLPAGLSLSSSGALTGTPTASGVFNFTVQVTDANQNQASRTYQLTILSAGQLLSIGAPETLEFAGILGGDPPDPQNIAVTSPSGAQTRISLQVDDGRGGAAPKWLQYLLLPFTGRTPVVIRVTPNTTSLAAGTYEGRLRKIGRAHV